MRISGVRFWWYCWCVAVMAVVVVLTDSNGLEDLEEVSTSSRAERNVTQDNKENSINDQRNGMCHTSR